MNSIHRVQAVVVLTTAGERIFAKYYSEPSKKLVSREGQRELEAALFDAAKQRVSTDFDIIQVKNHSALFITREDVIFFVIGDLKENPMFLLLVLHTLMDTLFEYSEFQILDARQLEENYELLILSVDEMLDDGIILDINASAISQSVREVSDIGADLPAPARDALTQLNKILRDNL